MALDLESSFTASTPLIPMPMTFSALKPCPSVAHAAEHEVIIHADDEPVLDLGVLHQHGVGGIQRPGISLLLVGARKIGPRGNRRPWRAGRPSTRRRAVSSSSAVMASTLGRLYVPLALLHLLVELLT